MIIIELKQWVIKVLVQAVMVSFYRIQAELSDLRQPMIHVIFGHSPEYSTVFGGIFLILCGLCMKVTLKTILPL